MNEHLLYQQLEPHISRSRPPTHFKSTNPKHHYTSLPTSPTLFSDPKQPQTHTINHLPNHIPTYSTRLLKTPIHQNLSTLTPLYRQQQIHFSKTRCTTSLKRHKSTQHLQPRPSPHQANTLTRPTLSRKLSCPCDEMTSKTWEPDDLSSKVESTWTSKDMQTCQPSQKVVESVEPDLLIRIRCKPCCNTNTLLSNSLNHSLRRRIPMRYLRPLSPPHLVKTLTQTTLFTCLFCLCNCLTSKRFKYPTILQDREDAQK